MKTVTFLCLLAMATAGTHPAIGAETKEPAAMKTNVLATLRKDHPRLMLTEARLAELKKLAETDPVLQRCVQTVLARADRQARQKPVVYKIVGPRLLSVSRDCLDRVYTMGLAWRWTGKDKYARGVRENLLAACAFKDWNPSHFLDTAEMSHAVGVGYDWLYGWLDAPTREKIRAGLIRHGMEPGIAAYTGKARYGWWRSCTHNWNQVCNGGLLTGALAIADTDPALAGRILNYALKSLPRALATYAPDGAWPEGPGYWHYATRYTVYALAAMDSALGTDFGLSKSKGLPITALFPLQLAGPIDRYFSFADTGSNRRAMSCQFWLARRYDLPAVAWSEHELISRFGNDAGHVIWYVPKPSRRPADAATSACFRGEVEVAVFRSAWHDSGALFVGVKAGTNRANHAHLDLGSFELDALGVRWAEDLGSDNYNLPGYWDTRQGGQRWKYYRLGSLSHNVPLLDNRQQDARAGSKVLKFVGTGAGPRVVIDLSAAYKPAARGVLRGVQMLPGKRAVLVQDEIAPAKACEVAWGMTTRAKIASEGNQAVLTLDGKELRATILSPRGARFSVESAEQKPPQKTNRGFRRLMIRLAGQKEAVRVAVLLAPVWAEGKQAGAPKVKALEEW